MSIVILLFLAIKGSADSPIPNSFKARAVDLPLRVTNTLPQQQNPKTLKYQKRSVVLNTLVSDNLSHSGLWDSPPNPRSPKYSPQSFKALRISKHNVQPYPKTLQHEKLARVTKLTTDIFLVCTCFNLYLARCLSFG